MKREQVLRAIEDSPVTFLKLIHSHVSLRTCVSYRFKRPLTLNLASAPQESAEEDVDLCEFFQALPRKLHGRVWSAVLQFALAIARRLGKSERELHEGSDVEKVRFTIILLHLGDGSVL